MVRDLSSVVCSSARQRCERNVLVPKNLARNAPFFPQTFSLMIEVGFAFQLIYPFGLRDTTPPVWVEANDWAANAGRFFVGASPDKVHLSRFGPHDPPPDEGDLRYLGYGSGIPDFHDVSAPAVVRPRAALRFLTRHEIHGN
ncbi:hypothetical protein [Paraburkholderia phytofirmans]|uniref:hypothetical protein n=1 Tax=Paraburkholderia phytofirmans TaxID=261302 RepID=UPI0011DFA5AA|nr:hypothetical protein [Paraburkholderia phytofirmans]